MQTRSWRERTIWPWELAPGMVLHSIQALHAECQMGGVRTVALRVPQSFFTFEDLSFGALCDEVK